MENIDLSPSQRRGEKWKKNCQWDSQKWQTNSRRLEVFGIKVYFMSHSKNIIDFSFKRLDFLTEMDHLRKKKYLLLKIRGYKPSHLSICVFNFYWTTVSVLMLVELMSCSSPLCKNPDSCCRSPPGRRRSSGWSHSETELCTTHTPGRRWGCDRSWLTPEGKKKKKKGRYGGLHH